MISIVESSNRICSRRGKAPFSPTVIEPNKAPPWKDIPIFLRISSISAAEVFARSRPLIHISPALGFSSPTRVRRSVLFPDPEPPRSEEHTSELQSHLNLVSLLLL